MSGSKAYQFIQLGVETVKGTAVDATHIWRGLGTPDNQTTVKRPKENIGYKPHVDRTYISDKLAVLELAEIEATFEQLPLILMAGIKNIATGVADGVGSGKKYIYPFPTTSDNDIKTLTCEGGDDIGAELMSYGFVRGFNINGKSDEALKMSANIQGRQWAPDTKTGGLSLPVVEEMLFNPSKLYIDGTTIGSTLISNTLLSMSLEVQTGWRAVATASGNLYFSHLEHSADLMDVVMNLTFLHTSGILAEKANKDNEVVRLIRFLSEGSALASAGTYSKKSLIIDLAGKWEEFNKLGEMDGASVYNAKLKGLYSSTAAQFATITVVNEVAEYADEDLS